MIQVIDNTNRNENSLLGELEMELESRLTLTDHKPAAVKSPPPGAPENCEEYFVLVCFISQVSSIFLTSNDNSLPFRPLLLLKSHLPFKLREPLMVVSVSTFIRFINSALKLILLSMSGTIGLNCSLVPNKQVYLLLSLRARIVLSISSAETFQVLLLLLLPSLSRYLFLQHPQEVPLLPLEGLLRLHKEVDLALLRLHVPHRFLLQLEAVQRKLGVRA